MATAMSNSSNRREMTFCTRMQPACILTLALALSAPALGQQIPQRLEFDQEQNSAQPYQAAVGQHAERLPGLELPRVGHAAYEDIEVGPDAPDVSIEDRLDAIERAMLADDLADAKRNEAEALKKALASKKPSLKWCGRINMDYWAFPGSSPGANAFENGDPSEAPLDRFQIRRARIGVLGEVCDNMLYRLDVDFNTPNNPQIKDCFIGWTELPYLQTVLVGNQKRPYGLDAINSANVNFFMERPAVIDAFNQDLRRFGAQSWSYSEDQAYNWRYGVFIGQDIQNLGNVTTTPVNESFQGELAGRFANTWWYDESSDGRGYGHWAISGALADPDGDDPANNTARFRTRPEARTTSRWLDTGPIDGADTYELLGLEALINIGPFQAVAEYQQIWVQRDGFADTTFNGAYGYISYVLTGEHIGWDRMTGQLGRIKPFENFFLVDTCGDDCEMGWGAWEVCARYSYCDLTSEDIEGGVSNETTLGMNWYWNEFTHMQFDYVHGVISDRAPVAGYTAGSFDSIGARFLVFF